MNIIGITGGVGSGKSEILAILSEICTCTVVRADELAKSLELPGEVCYEPLISLLGDSIIDEDGYINNKKMASAIFMGDDSTLTKVNQIIHPRVKERIISMIEDEKKRGVNDFFFLEAALLIEDHYDVICDEFWYIYATENIRRERLKDGRGYSDEKITAIMQSQLDDDIFRKYCRVVVDNSESLEYTRNQLIKILNEERYYLGQEKSGIISI